MKVLLVLALSIAVLCLSGKVYAGEECRASQEAAIKETSLNYVEGWYTGNAERVEKALHPDLAKRWIKYDEEGKASLVEMTTNQLIQAAKERTGENVPDGGSVDVVILDIHKHMATVRINSPWFVDYAHLANWNGQWVITNVLWE